MLDVSNTLIVDDEKRIRQTLAETMRRVGHTVSMAASGEEALDILQETAFDLAILDLKLGGVIDGQRILEAIRWRWPSMIVIMLTGHGSLESAMHAIREGIDGYLLKPIRPNDVREAVKEAVRRRRKILETQPEDESDSEMILQRGLLCVDLTRHVATLEGEELKLSPRDLALLVHLMQKSPGVVTPKELVRVVREYEPEYMHEAREIIKWYIHRLRKKVEPDPSNPRFILNVRGVGYRFAG